MESQKLYHNIKNKKKKIYSGIEILRMILSFLILLVHCYNKSYSNNKSISFAYLLLGFYVPTFFIISFYFSYKTFKSKNINKIKQRFTRILIPYIIWPIIFWLKYNFFNIFSGKKDKNIFKNLYYQLLIGHGFYGVFWFLFNLIFHSLFFTIIILLFQEKHSYIFHVIFIVVCIYNYLGYNFYIFSNYKHEVQHSIKPIMITLLYSINGFFLGSMNILEKLIKYRIIIIIYLSFIIYAIIKEKITIIKNIPKFYIFIINFVSMFIFNFCIPSI